MYRKVALPSATDVLGTVRDWVFAEPLRDLVAHFGGRIPDTDVRSALSWLDGFSFEHWDFRRGAERSEIAHRVVGNVDLIMAAAAALGLLGHGTPRRDFYDRILVLGGGAPACLLRPDFTAELLRKGLRTGGVAGLGSTRHLSEAEREIAGPGAVTEADALSRGFARAATAARIVTAGGVRANTADTYDAWRATDPAAVSTVLVVTTEIYVPFQHCDAIRKLALPLGCAVETVGVPATRALPDGFRQDFTPANHLQEIRSAIRSMRRLLAAVHGDHEVAESR